MRSSPPAAADEHDRPDPVRPWLLAGAVALSVARPLLPSEGAITSSDAMLFILLALVLAAAWALRAVMRRGTFARYGIVDLVVILLAFCQAASAAQATHTGAPRLAINAAWSWVALTMMYLLFRQLVQCEREVRAIAAVMIALAVALSAFGFYQFFYSIPRDQARYAADPEDALREAHVVAPPGSRQRVLFANRVNSSEPMATFALANSLAGFLTPWLAMSLGICAVAYVMRRRAVMMWVPAALCAVVLLACLLLTKSRAAYVGTAVAVLMLAAWTALRGARVSRGIMVGAVALVALLTAGAAVVGALDREVLSEAGKSLGYRLQYWQASWEMIREHPWLGCGPGQFQATYTRYKLPEASETVADPHNFLLEVWATAGTPAALALVALLLLWARQIVGAPGSEDSADESLEVAVPTPRNDAMNETRTARSRRARRETADKRSPTVVDAPPNATRHIVAGGATGFLVAFIVGPLATVPLGLAATLGGLCVASLVVAGLYPWVTGGRTVPALLGIAVIALLINLLAGGGIGFAGVAGSFWLLVALALVLKDRERRLNLLAAAAAFVTLAALCAVFYFTVYRPVLACNLALTRAELEPDRAETQLRAAAAADPLSFEPPNRLALLEWEHWQRHPAQMTFERVVGYLDEALRLNPRSAALAEQKGDVCLTAYRQSRDSEARALATSAYRLAVELHPTSITNRAKLALVLAEAGDAREAAAQARESLRLHELTPHEDQKLPEELLEQLEPLAK